MKKDLTSLYPALNIIEVLCPLFTLKRVLGRIESIFGSGGGFHGAAMLSLAPLLNLTISEDRFLSCVLIYFLLRKPLG